MSVHNLIRFCYFTQQICNILARGYKFFFMFNTAEHKSFSAYKLKTFSYLLVENFSYLAMFSRREFEIVSNLRFISRTNFMLTL